MPLKDRLVGKKPAIHANRLPAHSAVWQNVEQGVVDYFLVFTGCYVEVKVAGGGGTICSMVLEVVWFAADTEGCIMDVRALGASHPVGQQWIDQHKGAQSFPQFHLCSKAPGHCAVDSGVPMVHITQWRVRSPASLTEPWIDWGSALSGGGLGIGGGAGVLPSPPTLPPPAEGLEPVAPREVPLETGEQALMEKVKELKQKVRGLPVEEALPAAGSGSDLVDGEVHENVQDLLCKRAEELGKRVDRSRSPRVVSTNVRDAAVVHPADHMV
eukprot:6475188-Amphidinium_carterae.2